MVKIILKPLGNFLLKNWHSILPWLIILAMFIYFNISMSNKDIELAKLRTSLVEKTGQYEVAKNLYEGLALSTNKIKHTNDSLKIRLNDTERDLISYTQALLKYKISIDSIKTLPAKKDTIYINNNATTIDSTDRIFNYNYKDELILSGFFNTIDPFLLFIQEIKLLTNIEVAISQDDFGGYYWNIDTKSSFLKPDNVKVIINPPPTPWELFYGLDIISNSLNILSPNGVGLHGGVKKGNYAGRLDIRSIDGLGTYVGFSFSKYMKF